MANKYFDHGVALTVAWFGILLVNIASVRWFSDKWDKTIYIHAATGYIITVLTLVYVLKLGLEFELDEPHNFIGSLYVVVIIPVSITGMLSMIARKALAWNTKVTNIIRKAHKFMATFLVIGSFMQISSGISYYWNNNRENEETINYILVYLPFSIIIFFAFEVYYRMKKGY